MRIYKFGQALAKSVMDEQTFNKFEKELTFLITQKLICFSCFQIIFFLQATIHSLNFYFNC